MIEIASCVCPLLRVSLHDVLWNLSAAISYQTQLVYLQMHGHEFCVEHDPAPILARLKKARAHNGGH